MSQAQPRVTVVINTRNRRDELRRALRSVTAQTVSHELLVIDDASTDGTSDLVRAEFPQATLVRHDVPMGVIRSRNEAARIALGQILFTLDDDAEFSAPDVIERTLLDFDHPRVAAVGIPYCDANRSPEVYQRSRSPSEVEVLPHFIGTAHALRRDIFLSLGGYRETFIRQGEEPDLALRMLAKGLVVRAGRSALIHHHESPNRNLATIQKFAVRNDLLYALLNVPFPQVLAHLPGTFSNNLRTALSQRQTLACLNGAFSFLGQVPKTLLQRSPVSSGIYRLMRFLRHHPYTPLSKIEAELPPTPDAGTTISPPS